MSSSPADPCPTRRTRIVCISDTHNCTVKLPKGDVLIHAGDLTNQGSLSELTKAIQWLEKADFEAKIVIAGNHDKALDPTLSSNSSQHQELSPESNHFHNKPLSNPKEGISLFETHGPSITYLRHESAEMKLTDPKGPKTKFKVFGSPGTPGVGDKWAFGYVRSVEDLNHVSRKEQEAQVMTNGGREPDGNEVQTAAKIWSSIPPVTDILITHTPPYGHCDLGVVRGSDGETGETGKGTETETDIDRHLGCHSLFQRLSVVRPRLQVCGHVHRARGAERVRWSPPGPDTLDREEDTAGEVQAEWIEAGTEKWTDPSPDPKSAKISLVDLTARGRGKGSGKLDWNDKGKGSGEGRKETCVVNCAILASNYPHVGGKKFHKPVVVDLELSVCDEDGEK
ncbi:Metallo-dependent phosphatase-like protein [Pseudoneurospora amorphoporcata]|uniref:Metallo-dependent phosphatase-like protein n=1 Tax=Pseudoneurospora amorphoporcata TaxID=241081 RepID=A0AAN6SFV7_9PEZI|nr:Metallo-dependent phosphatase-like protein [Pseudoneurospora amorphoporcata]